MTTLSPTTRSRLQKIPLSTAVWEGDRRPLGKMASHLEGVRDTDEDCIIWIDGSEGAVRAMDVVPEDMGIEAVVRTLLRAIESPHHPAEPNRPQKIVVRDREIQFFLRGVLQDLDINIEYSPQLPLIDSLYEGFTDVRELPNPVPNLYERVIENVTNKIWHNAPWEILTDSDILQIELEDSEIDRVYVCVMGMMSAEYGVLLYRSLDSLKQFRATALGENHSPAELEKAFMAQDCWFLNYEQENASNSEFAAFFGSIHPFEGMRHSLDEAETKIVYAGLESLWRFCHRHRSVLTEPIEAISKSYLITLPEIESFEETISTKVSTMPELAAELLDLGSDRVDLTQESDFPISEDLIPDGSLVTLATIPTELRQQLQQQPKTYCQSGQIIYKAALPTVFIQTTRSKANNLISRIKQAGGLKAVCFNPGHDPFNNEVYDLGILQTQDLELHIFAEYSQDAEHQVALKQWYLGCKHTLGYCGLVISMGATGASRGNPQPKDMLALFEARAINGAELGMGVLQLMPNFEP